MGTITELPRVEIEGHMPSVGADASHPMRVMTRKVAGLGDGMWDGADRTKVGSYFDELAADWHTRVSPERNAVVEDVLARGVEGEQHGLAIEVGSGIGTYSPLLAARWDGVVAVELSMEMLRRSPAAPGRRVQADASMLPLPDASAAAVVLINMLLFPAEVDRVLAPGGIVVWVNSSGEETPIHLPPADVAAALPGEWEGVQSRAGVGLWCVLHRVASSTS
jgi:SAM-dependent methyltransferase